MAAYEVLNSFVTNTAIESLSTVAKLSDVILQRLEQTIPMQQQIVSVEDRITLEEIQTSLASVLLVSLLFGVHCQLCTTFSISTNCPQAIIQRLEGEIKPQADHIMHVLLQILSSVGPRSSVPDTIFAAIGSLSNALEDDFAKYMESFIPFLYKALANQEEVGLCSMAIGLVSDITRSLGERAQPYCDNFMNYLLAILSVGLKFWRTDIRLIDSRMHRIATNSGQLSFNALETLLRQSDLISRRTYPSLLRFCKRQQASH